MWCDILERIDKANKLLQSEGLVLKTVSESFASLVDYITAVRDECNSYEAAAMDSMETIAVTYGQRLLYRRDGKRVVKRKGAFSENIENETIVTPKEKFKTKTYLVICDSLLAELGRRSKVYETLVNDFDFIFHPEMDVNKRRENASHLVAKYNTDLEEEFVNELDHFHKHLLNFQKKSSSKTVNVIADIREILYSTVGVFPNVSIAFRIYLSIPCSVCEGERPFSKLARIKNEKRAIMGQDRLNSLSLMSIEHELARELDLNDSIRKFASAQARKVIF